jgi:primosomal protein DnaI
MAIGGVGMLEHIGKSLTAQKNRIRTTTGQVYDDDAATEGFFQRIPELAQLGATKEMVRKAQVLLLDYLRQQKICGACSGYESCRKDGDSKGLYDHLELYQGSLTVRTGPCEPYNVWLEQRRIATLKEFSGMTEYDKQFRFENFPEEQKRRFPELFAAALEFAEGFRPGERMKGLYIFGPAGVGKTHLLLAIVNRLEERSIPVIFVRAESIFDKLRSMIASGHDIEPIVNTYCQVPVLAIDEFAQERANEFTIDKMFRIINYRFSAGFPTLFTSNYEPPVIYNRVGKDLQQVVDVLKSRIVQMNRHGRLDGEDARLRDIEFLDGPAS